MIFREKNEKQSILIRQHDHGFLAGEIAKHIKEEFFEGKTYLKETVDAIYEHDRGWIELDKVPILNDAKIFHIHLWIVQVHYALFFIRLV
ncbi:hypothetical protein Bmyc01_44960 [Bacillus mycoides]|nr:hypothetical protein Bmyc01_44960 [Bacillus mycoides]